MEQTYLNRVLPFLGELEAEKQKQLEEYFNTAPVWLMDSFIIEKMEQGRVFVRENTPIDKIYVIAKGTVKATDYRVLGVAYDFMHFDGATYAMGGMEAVMNLSHYCTTLETVTPCTVIAIPSDRFRRWLETDIKALKQESMAVTQYLVKEARQGRAFLFLQGLERLEMLLIQKYDAFSKDGLFESFSTRNELAEESGLCVKTINRSVKKLEEDGLVGRRGNRLTINEQQYHEMREAVGRIIDF